MQPIQIDENELKNLVEADSKNLRNLSVVTLPNKVTGQAEQLKARFVDFVLNTERGLFYYLNTRYELIRHLFNLVKSQTNTKFDEIDDTSLEIKTNLNSEIRKREEEDEKLQSQITDEISRATTKENELDKFIKKEVSDRETAITNLLDGVVTNLNTFKKIATAINNDPNYFQTVKTERDQAIKQAIDDLVGGAGDALDTLKELADALGNDPNFVTTITALINTNKENIANEIKRATEAETSLQELINTTKEELNTSITTNTTNLEKKITDETSRATTKESELDQAIKAETSRATAKETAIEQSITNNVNTINETINTKIAQEVNDRNEAISTAITDLIGGSSTALDTLKELADALGNDPNFATTILEKLEDNKELIEAETSRATNKENELDTKITAINSTITNKINPTLVPATPEKMGFIIPGGEFDIDDTGYLTLYKEIKINSFSSSVTSKTIGDTVTSFNLSWSLSKVPTELIVNNDTITPPTQSGSKEYTGQNITSDKTFTIKVKDVKTTSYIISQTTINFYNKLFYGVSSSTTINNDFVLGLTNKSTNSRYGTYSVNAGTGEYIYFAFPSAFGTPIFKVGGLEGGFSLFKTLEVTFSNGYKQEFNIYKSTNTNLGNTSVEVS